jgi:hypothetical protein
MEKSLSLEQNVRDLIYEIAYVDLTGTQTLRDAGVESIDVLALEYEMEIRYHLINPTQRTWIKLEDTLETITNKVQNWNPNE